MPKKPHIGFVGRLSEKRLAKKLGVATPASGAMQGEKGDVKAGKTLMECKSTTANSMKLEYSWLMKIAYEARTVGKTPALCVSFVSGDGRPLSRGEWVLVPLSEFKEKFLDLED